MMSRKIGFWSVFALVTGSQIGTGVFILPASLAPFGILSLGGWVIAGLGAVMLALVFAKLCARFPRTGGPHAYVQEMFGPTASFFTGWTYWIISWVSTSAVITGSIGYLTPFIGDQPPLVNLSLEILLLFIFTAVNCKGVKTAGKVEFFLTALKMIPLLLVPVVALFFFDTQNFAPIETRSPLDISQMLSHVALLTLWGFVGLESATTPAGSIENPGKTIPRAVVWGTLFVAIVYIINSVSVMGAVPFQTLAVSKAPYADTARLIFGGNWHLVISLIASIVCIGTLNAWMLASGQIALGIAQDGLLPPLFAKQNKDGAPIWALLISCGGILPLLYLTQDKNLAQQVNTIIDFSVTSFLFVYAICTVAYLKMIWQQNEKKFWQWSYGIIALCFCTWVIAATPGKTLLISSVFTLSGIPIYVFRRPQLKESVALNPI
jgi:basic amino acid/polyamine antiporter, APA family